MSATPSLMSPIYDLCRLLCSSKFERKRTKPYCSTCVAVAHFLRSHRGVDCCAAKALFSCPAIVSQRLESRRVSKEPQENTEEESKII